MQNELDSLAHSAWKLAASAVDNPSLSNEDLERLLQFLSEVNDVLLKSFLSNAEVSSRLAGTASGEVRR